MCRNKNDNQECQRTNFNNIKSSSDSNIKINKNSFKAKLKKTDRQTNIDKYGVAEHKILQNIVS